VFLGEPFTFFDAVGTALILGGIGFYTWNDLRNPAAR
jgi:drug/metabolite transporter (DMT)-like permease